MVCAGDLLSKTKVGSELAHVTYLQRRSLYFVLRIRCSLMCIISVMTSRRVDLIRSCSARSSSATSHVGLTTLQCYNATTPQRYNACRFNNATTRQRRRFNNATTLWAHRAADHMSVGSQKGLFQRRLSGTCLRSMLSSWRCSLCTNGM